MEVKHKRKQPHKHWWWVRHGPHGYVQYSVPLHYFVKHTPKRKGNRHLGMCMPVDLYPTKGSLPVERTLIPIWDHLER